MIELRSKLGNRSEMWRHILLSPLTCRSEPSDAARQVRRLLAVAMPAPTIRETSLVHEATTIGTVFPGDVGEQCYSPLCPDRASSVLPCLSCYFACAGRAPDQIPESDRGDRTGGRRIGGVSLLLVLLSVRHGRAPMGPSAHKGGGRHGENVSTTDARIEARGGPSNNSVSLLSSRRVSTILDVARCLRPLPRSTGYRLKSYVPRVPPLTKTEGHGPRPLF